MDDLLLAIDGGVFANEIDSLIVREPKQVGAFVAGLGEQTWTDGDFGEDLLNGLTSQVVVAEDVQEKDPERAGMFLIDLLNLPSSCHCF